MKFFRKLLFLSLVILTLTFFVNYFSRGVKLDYPKGVQTDLPIAASPSPIAADQYSFAVISDIHSDYKNLQKTLSKIKEDKMSFVIAVGDLTTLGKMEELIEIKAVLDQSGLPYYIVPGNHDLWSAKTLINPFKDVFGADYQSFKKANVKFILINNGDGSVGIDQKQKTWLDKELVDCPQLYCLVFAHMPLNNPTSKHVMGEDSSLVAGQADLLVGELVNAQIKELFAGHIHYLSTYTLDGLKTTTDGAILDNPRFVEVTISQPETKLEEKQVWLE